MSLFVFHTKKLYCGQGIFDPIFSFWHKPSEAKNRKNHFAQKTHFLKKVKFVFFCPSRFFVNHKSKFFMYFSKSSSNVAASEIQNLKKSPDFSKMQKITAKFSRLFLVRSASFF
jgi:hypothetical protein